MTRLLFLVALVAVVLGAPGCKRYQGPDVPELLSTLMATTEGATRLCNAPVDGLRDVKISELHQVGPDPHLGSAKALVRGRPTGPAGAPAECVGTVTFTYNWTFVKGRSGPLELSIHYLGVADRAVWLGDLARATTAPRAAPLARPGPLPGPSPVPVGVEITSSLEARDADVEPGVQGHDYVLDLPTTKPLALVARGNADVVRGLGPTVFADMSVMRDGQVVAKSDGMIMTFVPPAPGKYVVRIKVRRPSRPITGTYTFRSAYDVAAMDLLTW